MGRYPTAGQPTKYDPAFHPQDYIRLSKQGKTLNQIALEWDINRDSIYEWKKKHKKFSDALKKGRQYAEGWYENIGQMSMLKQLKIEGQKVTIDNTLFIWLTKNMFKWSDKVDVSAAKPKKRRPLRRLSDEELKKLKK